MFHKGGEDKPKGFGFGGFKLGSSGGSSGGNDRDRDRDRDRDGPKPRGPGKGYSNPLAIPPPLARGTGGYSMFGKRRINQEDEYFDDDDDHSYDVNSADLEYLPAPGSPSFDKKDQPASDASSDESDDPLDAFMAGIEKEVEEVEPKKDKKKGIRDDVEAEDEMESYFRYMEENPTAGLLPGEEEMLVEYDEEGNPIIPEKNKIIDPLPAIDHDEIDYDPFEKNFYQENEEISRLLPPEVDTLRNKLGIRVSGKNPAKPVSSFGHLGFDDVMISTIRKAGYTQPTPIQAQGIPIAMGGRDIIGIAKTGSGKTAAFVWPLIVHLMDQKNLEVGDGPIGLILAPTRELSQQIYHEAKKFGKAYNIKVICCYGGGSMYEQSKACQEGGEIIVATPGRLIDLVKKKATNLKRVSYLVFDEADRMFDMGFEPQVRSIANHVRPDRQTLLFSATFRKKVERLARDILTDPIRVIQGELGEANEDITQIVEVFPAGPAKWIWLTTRLVGFTTVGSVLIFVTRKANCVELAENLKKNDHQLGFMHGDMSQVERNEIITGFKKKEFPVLVATDVAARGLDIPSIRTVINYDVARDIDTHTHRIGRTGRAGEKGTAYTFVTAKDKDFAGHLVRNLESANQTVPQALLDLAMQNPWFKKTRFRQGKGKRLNKGGQGLGFRERPGLGSADGGSSAYARQAEITTSGPQGDRVSAMKSAFANQFKSNFVSVEGSTWQPGTQHILYPNDSTVKPTEAEQNKKKKRTRWE